MTVGIQEVLGLLLFGGAIGGFVAQVIRWMLQPNARPGANGSSTGVMQAVMQDQVQVRQEWRDWVANSLRKADERLRECEDHREACDRRVDSLGSQLLEVNLQFDALKRRLDDCEHFYQQQPPQIAAPDATQPMDPLPR